jgi:DNA-binding NarL/FixJ family response regulator
MTDLIIASSHPDRLASWKQALGGFDSKALLVEGFSALKDEVLKTKPKSLLLDYDLLESCGVICLRKMCTETQTIIIGGAVTEALEWELLKAGIRGYCSSNSSPEAIRDAVVAVQHGELWIRRSLTSRLIDELGKTTQKNRAYRASLGLLHKLTQREYDIAERVANGQNNKQIAQACAITERTVKAHLTEVFQKLGVTDRLNLALFLSADEKIHGLGNSDEQPAGNGDSIPPQYLHDHGIEQQTVARDQARK